MDEQIEQVRQHIQMAIALLVENELRGGYFDEAIANLEDADYYITKEQ